MLFLQVFPISERCYFHRKGKEHARFLFGLDEKLLQNTMMHPLCILIVFLGIDVISSESCDFFENKICIEKLFSIKGSLPKLREHSILQLNNCKIQHSN